MRTVLIISAVLTIGTGQAQVEWEPTIGVNTAWINHEQISGETYSVGIRPVVGLGASLDIKGYWRFQPKVLYSYKGDVTTVTGLYKYSEFNAYVSTPLDVKWQKGSFGFGFGIVPGYWVSGRTRQKDIGGGGGNVTARLVFGDGLLLGRYNRIELALRAGLRYAIKVAGGNLTFDLTYNHGVVPIFQPTVPPQNYHYTYNRWVQLTAAYPLIIKN